MPPRALGFSCLAGVLEQKAQGLLGLDVIRDAAEGPILFKTHLDRGYRLAILTGEAFDLAVDFLPGRVDRFALADPGKKHRRLHFADRLLALGLLHLGPVKL